MNFDEKMRTGQDLWNALKIPGVLVTNDDKYGELVDRKEKRRSACRTPMNDASHHWLSESLSFDAYRRQYAYITDRHLHIDFKNTLHEIIIIRPESEAFRSGIVALYYYYKYHYYWVILIILDITKAKTSLCLIL